MSTHQGVLDQLDAMLALLAGRIEEEFFEPGQVDLFLGKVGGILQIEDRSVEL